MKRNIIFIIIFVMTLLSVITISTYAYFVTEEFASIADFNSPLEKDNMVFYTMGGKMKLIVNIENMALSNSGSIAAEDSANIVISFTPNTNYSVVCSYDIVYDWVSEDRYEIHSDGVTEKEYTMQATLTNNIHVTEGENFIKDEIDLADVIGDLPSRKVVIGAQIDGKGEETSTAIWNLKSTFYNVNANQDEHYGKNYMGQFRIANVECTKGSITK